MKKAISILTILILMISLVSCTEPKTEVSEKPINTDFVAAHSSMTTEYEYQWDWWNGEYRLLPVYKEVHYPDTYKLQYEITYSDGSTKTEWREVDKPTYDAVLKEIAEESEEPNG